MKHARPAVPVASRVARPPATARMRANRPPSSAVHPTAARGRGACACGGACPRCQRTQPPGAAPSLRIGPPHSPLERAADRAAARVTGPQAGATPPLAAGHGLGSLHSAADAGATQAAAAPASVQSAVSAPGRTLDGSVRSTMETRFGQSFGDVRIHTDGAAAASAAAIDASAYTVGSHIVFGSGRFSPESDAGQRLLAHELAHVVQQEGNPTGVVQRALWNDFFEPADWGNGGGNGGFFENPFAPAPQGGGSGSTPFFSVNAERPNDDTSTGHAWVALDDGKGKHKAWGFYAACVPVCSTVEYLEIAAGKWVPGDVRDDSFARPTDQGIYFISQSKYEAAMQLMEQSDPILYNLWEYNCVDYARTVAQLFGITIPDFPGIDEPEELGDWIASGARGR